MSQQCADADLYQFTRLRNLMIGTLQTDPWQVSSLRAAVMGGVHYKNQQVLQIRSGLVFAFFSFSFFLRIYF